MKEVIQNRYYDEYEKYSADYIGACRCYKAHRKKEQHHKRKIVVIQSRSFIIVLML